jgi:hypothetical protein
MTLGEAMRKGAAQRPQCFGSVMRQVGDEVTGTCALGAAYEGAFGFAALVSNDDESLFHMELEDVAEADGLNVTIHRACPVCGPEPSVQLLDLVAHLNDMHDWSRERIADWLDALSG